MLLGEILGDLLPHGRKMRCGFGPDKMLEILVRKADGSTAEANTWSEIGTQIERFMLIETGHCRKINNGNRAR
ncbi:MAG: hypothetical protein GY725_00865 [bacterium]|nr:hypothetical protein [bacterium]